MSTRVLVADPVAVFRVGVRNVLARSGGFDVVEAKDLDGVLRALRETPPDVALIDLGLPPAGAVAATEALARTARTIVWSLAPDQDAALAAIRAGAFGFLSKQLEGDALVTALHRAARGEALLTHELAGALIAQFHRLGALDRVRRRAALLTAREHQVLELLVAGARNRQIADTLEISEFTVKRHIQNILQKLDLPTRRAAAELYRQVSRAGAQAEVVA